MVCEDSIHPFHANKHIHDVRPRETEIRSGKAIPACKCLGNVRHKRLADVSGNYMR